MKTCHAVNYYILVQFDSILTWLTIVKSDLRTFWELYIHGISNYYDVAGTSCSRKPACGNRQSNDNWLQAAFWSEQQRTASIYQNHKYWHADLSFIWETFPGFKNRSLPVYKMMVCLNVAYFCSVKVWVCQKLFPSSTSRKKKKRRNSLGIEFL